MNRKKILKVSLLSLGVLVLLAGVLVVHIYMVTGYEKACKLKPVFK